MGLTTLRYSRRLTPSPPKLSRPGYQPFARRGMFVVAMHDLRPLRLGNAPYARDGRRHLKLLTAVILLIIEEELHDF
jgi:hypothetical protein